MTALYTAILHFGSFLVVGWVGKLVLTRWMRARRNAVRGHDRFRGTAGKGRRFLLSF